MCRGQKGNPRNVAESETKISLEDLLKVFFGFQNGLIWMGMAENSTSVVDRKRERPNNFLEALTKVS